jgi:hypothetical protein
MILEVVLILSRSQLYLRFVELDAVRLRLIRTDRMQVGRKDSNVGGQ